MKALILTVPHKLLIQVFHPSRFNLISFTRAVTGSTAYLSVQFGPRPSFGTSAALYTASDNWLFVLGGDTGLSDTDRTEKDNFLWRLSIEEATDDSHWTNLELRGSAPVWRCNSDGVRFGDWWYIQGGICLCQMPEEDDMMDDNQGEWLRVRLPRPPPSRSRVTNRSLKDLCYDVITDIIMIENSPSGPMTELPQELINFLLK